MIATIAEIVAFAQVVNPIGFQSSAITHSGNLFAASTILNR
jgi:hypothetical protein